MKKQKGITLIALIITVIVLLILAGVSINMALGDNGILDKTKSARREKIVSEKVEEVKFATTSLLIENNGDGSGITISDIAEKIKENYNANAPIEGVPKSEIDGLDEEQENNVIGLIEYGKSVTGLSEKLSLVVGKDFYLGTTDSNFDFYVDEFTVAKDIWSELEKVEIEPSTYTNKFGGTWCNSPDLSGFNPESTYYVVYDGDTEKIAGRIDRIKAPDNWCDYGKTKPGQSEGEEVSDSHWANVVTVTGNDVTYWTWIPRYKFKILGTENVDVKFVDNEHDDICYIKTEEKEKEEFEFPDGYELPDSFMFEDNSGEMKQLSGYWVSKYEVQETGREAVEKVYATKYGSTVKVSSSNPTGKYRIYIEGVEYDTGKSDGVELPYTINGLRRNKKYDICIESITRNKMIGRTSGASTDNIRVDKSGFNPNKTYYVVYDENGNESIAGRIDSVPEPKNWYNYSAKIWANLVTINENNVTFWTYIPRYEYRIPTSDQYVDIKYIPQNKETPDALFEIPDSFTFEDNSGVSKPLAGYWVSKYEIQISELYEQEVMVKKIKDSKVNVTTTNPNGTYTLFINGKFYKNNIDLKEPYVIDLNKDSINDVLLVHEGDNRPLGESSTSKIEVDLSGFNPDCTYYVEYDESGNEKESKTKIQLENGKSTNMPQDWYDYNKKKWANIVTINTVNGVDITTYWTYIPRYEFRIQDTEKVDLKYISKSQTVADELYQIPESFTFEDNSGVIKQLSGYWVSKYEVQDIDVSGAPAQDTE